MITIVIESKKYNCVVDLHQKVTVISGDSGTGKSMFAKSIADDSRAYKISLNNCDYELYVINANWKEIISYGIEHKRKSIYIIDDCDFVITREFNELIRKDKYSYYIIITRFGSRLRLIFKDLLCDECIFKKDGINHTIIRYAKDKE